MKSYIRSILNFYDEHFVEINRTAVPELNGRYSISNHGNIRDNYMNALAPKYINTQDAVKRIYVDLIHEDHTTHTYPVDILVGVTFKPETAICSNQVSYYDSDPFNCTPGNIRWIHQPLCSIPAVTEEDRIISEKDIRVSYKFMAQFPDRKCYGDVINILELPYDKNDPKAKRNLERALSSIRSKERYLDQLKDYPDIIEKKSSGRYVTFD